MRSADGSRLLGMVEASQDRESQPGLLQGEANISYALGPTARGHGYATRAVGLVEEYLRDRGESTAVITAHVDNAASLAVARRRGFTDYGVTTSPDGVPMRRFTKRLTGNA